MGKKLGALIKTARNAADLTQEQLAKKIGGVTASEVSRVERGEVELTQAQVKKAATALGVTQKSLLDAMPKSAAKKTSATASSGTTMKVSAAERKLVEAYRNATADQRKNALSVLRGEHSDVISSVGDILGDVVGNLFQK